MEYKQLKKLTVYIENEEKEDIVIIFDDPSEKDLQELIRDEWLLNTVNNIFYIKKEKIEEKNNENLQHERKEGHQMLQEVFLEANKEHRVLKKENNLDDFKYHVEGDIQGNVKEEIIWNNDEGIRDLLDNSEVDNLHNRDISLDNDVPYDEFLEVNVDETIQKFEDQLDRNKIFLLPRTNKKGISGFSKGEKLDKNSTKDDNVQTKHESCECDVCGKILGSAGTLKKHKLIHEKELPSCKLCEMTFTRLQDLYNHLKIHKDEPNFKDAMPFPCDICDKAFHIKSLLTIHQRSHTGEKPFVCDVCGKSCYNKRTLTDHKQSHTGIKPFPCDICDKKYYQKNVLRRHMESHNPDRPTFQCTICKKEFTRTSFLRDHMKLHEGLKPHVCDICGKSFLHKAKLVVHSRIHTGEKPYSCDLCDKSFHAKDYLQRHKIFHTGNKSFSCEVCKKKFFTKTSLEEHLRVHTGEKPYSCEHCGKTFAFSGNFNRHKKSHADLQPKTSVNDQL